jgi:hypothetical protein
MAEILTKPSVKRSMSTSQTGYIEGQIHKHPALRICFFLMVLLWPFGHRHAASQDQLPLSEQLVGGEFSYVVQKEIPSPVSAQGSV